MERIATWFALLLIASPLSAAEPQTEFRAPAFDAKGVAASWVVAVPPGEPDGKGWPLVLDFHGAIAPSRKGANLTRAAIWSVFVAKHPYLVVGLNSRTRAWGMVKGEMDDRAFARHVLSEVRKRYPVDPSRVYLAGFSSGSDFLLRSGIATEEWVGGCLVVCPGPPSVVGLRGGELLAARAKPFVFVTGEEDYVRKSGAWEAFLALEEAGGQAAYREVPGEGHSFPSAAEYADALARLERMARGEAAADSSEILAAVSKGDYLRATATLPWLPLPDADELRTLIENEGRKAVAFAAAVPRAREPGAAYEAWWAIATEFHRFPKVAERARQEMAAIERAVPRRDLYRARRDWFRRRARPLLADPVAEPGPRETAHAFGFDRYLTFAGVEERLKRLAKEYPDRARLFSMGKSVEGRDLWVLEVTDRNRGEPSGKPAVYAQGGLHGNEISSVMTVLYFAWQLAANPEKSRGTERVLRDTTFYLAPVVNPDGHHHCMTEAHSPWRPQFNYRPHDADGDGKVDEDPYEDLNGDGEIGRMYAPDDRGPFVLRDGRMVRGKEGPTYRVVGLEGIDNDGDGNFNEDRPGGVNLNRNFPVGFRARREYEGTRGTGPASEPETTAIMAFVEARPNVALFLDVHNFADCLYYWLGPGDPGDAPLYEQAAERVKKALGYRPRPLTHPGAGLAISWSYGVRGIPSLLIELEPALTNRDVEWGPDAFIEPRPFEHPQLGPVLIGNDYRKIALRNPHPGNIFWQADRNFAWLKAEAPHLPRIEIRDPEITAIEGGFTVSGHLQNPGTWPLDCAQAFRAKTASGIRVTAEGAAVVTAETPAGLAGGEEAPFSVSLAAEGKEVNLVLAHRRAGRAELAISRPRSPTIPIRTEYRIEPGFETPDTVRRKDLPPLVAGPAFEVPRKGDEMRVAVLLGDWADRPRSFEAAAFDRAFFSRGTYRDVSPTGQPVYGSLADFFAEMSYGRVKVTGKVFGWVTLPGSYAEYRDASFGSRMLTDRLLAAVRARDGDDALEGFDGLAVIWAGNAVARTSMLWPMRLSLKDLPGLAAFKTSERLHGEFLPIGVACHEMGHTFGVNDKYGLGASKNPLGPFCLIGRGTHGAEPSRRHRPFRLCAWCRSVIGWVHPAVVRPDRPRKLALRPALFGEGKAYRIPLTPDGEVSLILTNRRREGFDTDLPSAGLFVLRVGPDDKPSAPQARVELLPAHGRPPADRSTPAEPEAVAWPQPGRTEFTVEGVTVRDIRIIDDVVYFEVRP